MFLVKFIHSMCITIDIDVVNSVAFVRIVKEILMEVVVFDAIMGEGKTKRIKEEMLLEDRPILYITPLLSEVCSVVGVVHDDKYRHVMDDTGCYMYDLDNPVSSKNFVVPNTKNVNNSKVTSINRLIANKENISSTHNLFSMLDQDAMVLLKENDYVLIVDESLSVWNGFSLIDGMSESEIIRLQKECEMFDNSSSSISVSDRSVLDFIKNGVIEVDPVGLLHWQEDKFTPSAGTPMFRVKCLCDLKQLYLANGKVVFWELNSVLIRCFSKVIIGTYMFEYSYMSHYLDVYDIPYKVERFGNSPTFYKEFINIVQGRINDVGDKDYSLSFNSLCVKKHSQHPKEALRKNLSNFNTNICKNRAGERIWTTFVKISNHVSGARGRYVSDWIAYNTKATNKYRKVRDVAYMCNNFPNTYLVSMLNKRSSRRFDQDMWALSECLQFIFRSRIRGGFLVDDVECRSINLYIPSKRMRDLLECWLDGKFEGLK